MIWGSHQDSTILSIIWPELGLYYLTYHLTSGGHQNSTIISIIWPGAAIRTLQSYPSSDLRQPSGLYSPTHDLMFWWSSCVYYLLPSYFLIYPRTSFSVFLYLSSQVFSHIGQFLSSISSVVMLQTFNLSFPYCLYEWSCSTYRGTKQAIQNIWQYFFLTVSAFQTQCHKPP